MTLILLNVVSLFALDFLLFQFSQLVMKRFKVPQEAALLFSLYPYVLFPWISDPPSRMV
jgi:hypothetical protein